MEIRPGSAEFYDVEADALVVPVFEGEKADSGSLKDLDERSAGIVAELLGSDEMKGRPCDMVLVHRPGRIKASRLLLIGVGKQQDITFDTISRVTGAAVRFLRDKGAGSIALMRRSNLDPERSAQAVAEGAIIASFESDTYRTQNKEERRIKTVTLLGGGDAGSAIVKGIERGRIIGESMNIARELINEPSSVITPRELAARARRTAEEAGLEVEVLDEKRMKELKMGALLGVGQGSDEPPRLVILKYKHKGSKSNGCIAVVGKGITFDTGGISIKPADSMDRMKYDMSGAASTLAILRAVALLKPDVDVIGLMACAENMPSGKAYKPGDILHAMSGKTIEVINTDAEGRLVLADALAYACQLGATKIFDMATLTGACSIALGATNVAMLGNDQQFLDQTRASAVETGEKFWQLPMDDDYRALIKSDIADIKNSAGRLAGTITAAWFLREFVGETPWIHLDIAGTAWESDRKPHIAKGPTGVTIRALVNYICNHSQPS